MARTLTVLVVLAAVAASAAAQEEGPEPLWLPDGYRFLSIEERQALPPAELAAIGKANSAALQEAIKKMTVEERTDVAARLARYADRPEATAVEKQYVTMASMQILATGMAEHDEKLKKEQRERLEALIREQEEKSKGFASDAESVQSEAYAVEGERARRGNPRELYLRILKPLRARPWNQEVRLVFRRLVRGNRYELLDPALAFVRARTKESPEEGAWPSLEAFLLLSIKEDVAEAKKLFDVAVSKNARDLESRIFPLLIAEIEGNSAGVGRYRARAREAWPKEEDLEKVLFQNLSSLPASLQEKARQTFEARYRSKHPADWEARYRILAAKFWSKDYEDLENEITTLLALPVTLLPEDHRLEFSDLRLRAKAARGRCAEAERGIAALEAQAEKLHPSAFDPNVAPHPRTEADVRRLRAFAKETEEQRRRLERWRSGDTKDLPPELASLKIEERRALVDEALAQMASGLDEAGDLMGRDDLSAASEWSRRELQEWEKGHGVEGSRQYDIQGKAEEVSISIRTDTGICYLDHGDPNAAMRVLTPAIGAGKNLHGYPIGHLVKAATLVAESGRVDDAVRIYERLRSGDIALTGLYQAIEKTAPGRLRPPPAAQPNP